MLADKLNKYKGGENSYIDENIQEIQELFMDKEQKIRKGTVEYDEVILIKPYEVDNSMSLSTKSSSFINEEIDNLFKYMKFIKSPTQTRIFRPPPYYQLLRSRGEQNYNFWKEVAIALVDNKYNMETSRNRYFINMFQERPPHELYFITINNWGQVIIGPNKKTVIIYVVGELKVLV